MHKIFQGMAFALTVLLNTSASAAPAQTNTPSLKQLFAMISTARDTAPQFAVQEFGELTESTIKKAVEDLSGGYQVEGAPVCHNLTYAQLCDDIDSYYARFLAAIEGTSNAKKFPPNLNDYQEQLQALFADRPYQHCLLSIPTEDNFFWVSAFYLQRLQSADPYAVLWYEEYVE